MASALSDSMSFCEPVQLKMLRWNKLLLAAPRGLLAALGLLLIPACASGMAVLACSRDKRSRASSLKSGISSLSGAAMSVVNKDCFFADELYSGGKTAPTEPLQNGTGNVFRARGQGGYASNMRGQR